MSLAAGAGAPLGDGRGGHGLGFWGSIHGARGERCAKRPVPGQDATPAGRGSIHVAVGFADRALPLRANRQPVGLRSVVPSMRIV